MLLTGGGGVFCQFVNVFLIYFICRFGLEDFDFGQSIKYVTATFENTFFLEEV
jgi:hypothetical protein